MIEWEPNKNDANLNIPVDGQVASICWNEQTKLLTMSLAYSAVYGMGEVSFYDGSTGKESRNCYPQQYTKAYTKFLGDNHVLFSRAGYMGQHTTPCHWGGDQQSTNDELRHVLSAGLSAALSGILFWGFDLAGFAGPLPTLDLYRRATMLACFTPIMQWHSEPDGGQFKELMPGGEENNERSPWNMAAVYNSPEFVTEMRFWHWLRMNLQPYLMATA